ncbi:MAG TPA: pilus assembly protein TadG-related protein, partial [Vicinamibacterales bacterium]|nr:pilus assembly protein TadG-related protein [Vicinamibacterales bacterium]
MIPSPVVSRTLRASSIPVCAPAAPGLAARRRQRGAVLVHVAVAMTGLLAFSALTIDLGSLWVARGQAQNAADAGALAG